MILKEEREEHVELNKIFAFLIVYYWVLIYIPTPSYILLTLPIGVFVFYMILIYIKNFSLSNNVSFILLFVLFSAYLSLVRFDSSTFSAVSLLGLSIFFIDHFKLSISLKLLNSLFFISLIISIPLYYAGYNYYGFIPGQAGFSHDEVLSGRVSLFPNVTTSIYFSFIIFFINYFFNQNHYQKLLLFISSLYFIYFGVSRTVMLGLIFIFFLHWIMKVSPLRKNWFYQLFIPSIFIVLPIVFVIFIEEIITSLLALNNEFISNYFFRGLNSVEEVLNDIARTNIWSEHIRLFLEHPWGLSTEQIAQYVNPSLNLSDGGSESFLTKILVRFGFGAIFLYFFLFALLHRALIKENKYLYVFVYIFIFIGVTYGSFFAAYNMLFLVFMSSINYKNI